MKANMSELAAALQATLTADTAVQGFDGRSSLTIHRDEPVNTSADQLPWISVYRRHAKHDPDTLGPAIEAWRASDARLVVIAQYGGQVPSTIGDKLDELVKLVLNALFTRSGSFWNYVGLVNSVDVSYAYNEADTPSMYMQTAMIEIVVEVDHEAS